MNILKSRLEEILDDVDFWDLDTDMGMTFSVMLPDDESLNTLHESFLAADEVLDIFHDERHEDGSVKAFCSWTF